MGGGESSSQRMGEGEWEGEKGRGEAERGRMEGGRRARARAGGGAPWGLHTTRALPTRAALSAPDRQEGHGGEVRSKPGPVRGGTDQKVRAWWARGARREGRSPDGDLLHDVLGDDGLGVGVDGLGGGVDGLGVGDDGLGLGEDGLGLGDDVLHDGLEVSHHGL